MKRYNNKSLISFALIALSIIFAVFISALPIAGKVAKAESSKPVVDGITLPIPPAFTECWLLLAAYKKELGKPGGSAAVLEAEFFACQQRFKGQWNDYGAQVADYWHRRAEQISQTGEFRVKLAVFGAFMDATAFITTKMAYETANLILGIESPDGKSYFWEQDFGTFLFNTVDQAAGVFIERFDTMHEFSVDFGSGTPTKFGLSTLCKKPSPLDINLMLGMPDAGMFSPGSCTLSRMLENFEAISDMVTSGEALRMHREPFRAQNNDLHVGLEIHSNYIDAILSERERAKLSRLESEGMRQVTDMITQRIKWPSIMANQSLREMDPVKLARVQHDKQEGYMVKAFWEAGLQGIGILTLTTFLNRLAFGFLDKLLNPSVYPEGHYIAGSESSIVRYNEIMNVDSTGDTHNYYERQAFAKSLGDFIVPAYFTQEDKDLITELSTCPPVRGRWHCSMDQSLAISIGLGARDGALTIGKAAGVGSEATKYAPNSQGLNPNWELIPENDIVNNTDPACYQRAYCAGNLKKLRLARILPVGFEMAANSPYNIKRGGKYVTLGTVINGFYDCNAEGKADKDYPWCHLVDPNWILTAPRYQCRTKGYGDAITPGMGTRQEECGDIATCLGTNQKGECIDGYGYCLAERTSYKFDAPECSEQYASCRTYTSSQGQSLSALRYTLERGACTAENVGCMWYALNRYATSTVSPDGLWVGNLTQGPRAYLDGGVESCSAEGCVKVFHIEKGQPALNLINNSSFEKTITDDSGIDLIISGFEGWMLGVGQCTGPPNLLDINSQSYFGGNSLRVYANQTCDQPSSALQEIHLERNRNYTLSMYVRSDNSGVDNGSQFSIVSRANNNEIPSVIPAVFEQCGLNPTKTKVVFNKEKVSDVWTRQTCQFVSPNQNDLVMTLKLASAGHNIYFDAVLLEEGEYINSYVETVAGLDESYIKIAPDEYSCTGNDELDHPSCKNFARACREIEVGCQGYTDAEDPSAPEIPAILSPRDYCPGICAGYGEYRKLASAFDLVQDPIYPQFNDPDDLGIAYIIPSQALSCSVQSVGCEPFTNMSAAGAGGEQISYFNYLRSCELPNESSRTYFTWEGSDLTGYELRTWALIASSTTDLSPKIVLKGAQYGDIKDPNSCTEDLWKSGTDPDCRQFYDEQGLVYYRYYSQTVSSNSACTLFRKDDSSAVDCSMTGGNEYVAQSRSCLYYALPSESSSCPAVAGGCRAYMGPTGRNAVQVYFESFMADDSLAGYQSTAGSNISRSEESVLVGDYSLKVDSSAGSAIQVERAIELNTTSTLYRISFWAKALSTVEAGVIVDGQNVGTFTPTMIWQRFEFGPFESSSDNPIVSINAPASMGTLFIDTIKLDQLNDVRFLIKDSWTIPATCDTSPEGTPEPRAMLGCREYYDRDGNQAFARNFSSLCRADSIGCKAFIDTRGMPRPYSETRIITGTQTPSQRADLDARTYENQYIGDWSVTSPAWRYYYAIDDFRARCDESQNSCRAFGKPIFAQNRLTLEQTKYNVDPTDTELLKTQDIIYEFQTVLLKHNWDAYYNSDTSINLACRKDELHCDRFQSGNVTEYFRNPGNHACEWRNSVALTADPSIGIYSNSSYGGWFRVGTGIPCYPGDDSQSPPKAPYLKGGDTFGAYFTGEDPYSGWVSHCPVNQSECTEFIDSNDTSDPTRPFGRSYFLINSRQLDTRSCGGHADPLSGCVLFNNKSMGTLQASSGATYQKSLDERGAAQTPIDCINDIDNPYCKVCVNFVFKNIPAGANPTSPGEILDLLVPNTVNTLVYTKQLIEYSNKLQQTGHSCSSDLDCLFEGQVIFATGMTPQNFSSFAVGSCGRKNDSNVIIKTRLDRKCARWMGCRTGETVYDPTQQKFVNQCSSLELCERNSSLNEDIFCAQFTDRNEEDLLAYGKFVDLSSYSGRVVKYGALDYSGYTIPNQYLLPDIKPRYVGRDVVQDPKIKDIFNFDMRLATEISLDSQFIEKGNNHKGVGTCRDNRSGLVGYQDINKNLCILAIGSPSSFSLLSGGQTGNDLSRNAEAIIDDYLQNNISINNSSLQSAMPAPECQLFPESTSPLPNYYVESWNRFAYPPIPEKLYSQYDGAKACVFGEDCSCSYRKIRYGGSAERYYSVDGRAPVIGVCVGGATDGRSCVPGGYIPVDSQNRILFSMRSNNQMEEMQNCHGGLCASIQDVVIHNGQYGYCLERDRARIGVDNQIIAPCLTWSPHTVIGGKYDLTHYSPTAGYIPPQGSGEYYCTTGANEQRLVKVNVTTKQSVRNWEGDVFISPGNNQRFEFSLPNVWSNTIGNNFSNKNIDGSINQVNNKNVDNISLKNAQGDSQSILGGQVARTMQFACRRAALCLGYPVDSVITDDLNSFTLNKSEIDISDKALDFNPFEGRWITTGSGPTKSYIEYFVVNKKGIQGITEKEFDYRYGLFRFNLKPYSIGAACKWHPAWVGKFLPNIEEKTDFSCQDYLRSIENISSDIMSGVANIFSGIVDRSSEKILTSNSGEPHKLNCIHNGSKSGSDTCYYKFWEVDYRSQDQEKFTWVDNVKKDPLNRFSIIDNGQYYYSRECSSNNPYFSIRAMFENVNRIENSMPIEEVRNNKLSGPWQFVGFWITACAPSNNANDPAHLYMEMDYVKVDVCKEVAQVISPATRESAPFADRVWALNNFVLPTLGVSYESRNAPFGSALATDKIGNDPMLMGISVPISGEYARSPSFVDSGISIQSVFNAQNSWAPLSNLFARIYKVYRWSPSLVTATDWACINGSKMGFLCPTNANAYAGIVHCGDFATCETELDRDLINQLWRCNSLSGVNRGMGCGQQTGSVRNTDPICHNAAMFFDPKQPDNIGGEPLLSTCVPGDIFRKNKLAFSLKTTGYVINNETDLAKEIGFTISRCTDDRIYAVPINPNLGNKIWHHPEAMLYGLLLMATKYGDAAQSIDICVQSSSGSLVEMMKTLVKKPLFRVFYQAEVSKGAPNLRWDGFYNNELFTNMLVDYIYAWDSLDNRYALGRWDNHVLPYIIDYRCDNNSVNSGHRCLPGSNVGEDNSFPGYYSNQCPQRIDACPVGTANADTNGDGRPNCGLCVFTNDEYQGMYEAKGQPTGYCQYFNPLSRCTKNSDCVFTEFEFWGAYDNPDPQPIGLDLNNSKAALPLVHSEKDTLNWGNPQASIPHVNLPRPLFPVNDYHDLDKLSMRSQALVTTKHNPFDIPFKYSDPTMLLPFTGTYEDNFCRVKATRTYICKPIYTAIFDVIQQNPGHVDGVFKNFIAGYNPINPGDSWMNYIIDWGITNYTGQPPWLLVGNIAHAVITEYFNPSDDRKRNTIASIIKTLTQDLFGCTELCAVKTNTVPNAYAAHFEKIINDSKNKKLRTTTLAPFVVNPLYRELRSIGYQTAMTEAYYETEEDEHCGRGDSIQGRQVFAYFIQGRVYEYLWRFAWQHLQIKGDDAEGCGDEAGGFEDEEMTLIHRDGDNIVANDFRPILHIDPKHPLKIIRFIDIIDKAKGWQAGLQERVNSVGNDSLLNDDLPWRFDDFYFSSIFPLMLESARYEDLQLEKDYMHYKEGNMAVPMLRVTNRVVINLGTSKDLADAYRIYLDYLDQFIKIKDKYNCTDTNLPCHLPASPQLSLWKMNKVGLGSSNQQPPPEAMEAILNAEHELKNSFAILVKQYTTDFKRNFADKSGWGTVLSQDYDQLHLFPGAVPVVQPAEGKKIDPLYLPGHCEPPKNGTDYDTIKSPNMQSLHTAKVHETNEPLKNYYGRPVYMRQHHNHKNLMGDDMNLPFWNNAQLYTKPNLFLSSWERVPSFFEQYEYISDNLPVIANQAWALPPSGKGQSNQNSISPVPRFCKHEVTEWPGLDIRQWENWQVEVNPQYCGPTGYKDEHKHMFIGGLIDQGSMYIGDDIKIKGPTGPVSDYRTTCRCEGGKFDGQPKGNERECNRGLPDSDNPNLYNPMASYLDQPSEYCKPVSKPDGTPQSYCQSKFGIQGHPDPDLDDNWCTHKPGYIPRGDVCGDGRDNCLTMYNLSDLHSTNHINNSNLEKTPKTAPSATDVTAGLDSYKFLTGSVDPYIPGRDHVNNKPLTSHYRPRPPRLAAPDMTRQSASAHTLPVSTVDAFSLNGATEGLIYFGGGQGMATIRFYAWSAHDQGPLKKIFIDWGDGNYQQIDNAQLKNRKPVCGSTRECEFIDGFACTSNADCPPAGGACLEKGMCKKQTHQTCTKDEDCGLGDECDKRLFFGNSTEACQQGYFEFSHVYRCDTADLLKFAGQNNACGNANRCEDEPNLTCANCRIGEACVPGLAVSGGCYNVAMDRCRYTPRVMVVDNWGWCTGDCSRTNEIKPGDSYTSARGELVRHPYGGCWDGSKTKINSEVTKTRLIAGELLYPGYSKPLQNECKPYYESTNYFATDSGLYYRPWIIYKGAIEVSVSKHLETRMSSHSGINLFSKYINLYSLYAQNPIMFKKFINVQ